MDDVVCRVIDLPSKVNAVTVMDSDGCYNVYVNAKLSRNDQIEAYDHECRHIKKDHFYKKEKSVSSCEAEAKEKSRPATA